jgi:poly(A) polymerase
VGAHFGVVLVRQGDAVVEVATFRSDHAYADGRHPGQVVFESDPREDVIRRDFTINALLMDPDAERVIDYVNGRADLEAGVVRAIGDPERRFREDHLRMLRAVRFAARLGFAIDPETMRAIQRLHSLVSRVSAERIRGELTRILTEGGARRGFELLDQSGLLEEVLPEISAMKGVEQPPEYHPEGDVWKHTLMMLDGLKSPGDALAWGVLLHDVGKPGTFRRAPDRIRFDGHVELGVKIARNIMRRLRFSNAVCEQVLALVANHMKFKDVPRMKESTLKRFLRLPDFAEHLELHRLDCANSNGNLETHQVVSQKLKEIPPEQLKPPRMLSGSDLIAAGYRPGPQFSEMLQSIEDAQLEGRIHDRDEALQLVVERYGRP